MPKEKASLHAQLVEQTFHNAVSTCKSHGNAWRAWALFLSCRFLAAPFRLAQPKKRAPPPPGSRNGQLVLCGQRAVAYFFQALKHLPKEEAWTIIPHLLQLAAYDEEVVGTGEGATTSLRDCFTAMDLDSLTATARLWLPWTPQLLDLIRRGKGGVALKKVMESNCRENPQHVCVNRYWRTSLHLYIYIHVQMPDVYISTSSLCDDPML